MIDAGAIASDGGLDGRLQTPIRETDRRPWRLSGLLVEWELLGQCRNIVLGRARTLQPREGGDDIEMNEGVRAKGMSVGTRRCSHG